MGGEEVTTEAEALADIVTWSASCPNWQRDALRRLCLKGELDAADIDELTALCRGDTDCIAEPLDKSHVRDPAAASATVVLKGVHRVQHVNALAEGEQLTFDKIGVTVVYGDNGSGKSGYARILKKACRARVARGETIHQNVYATKAGIPTAVVDFTVNGINRSETWLLGKEADPLLSAVSVFDSRAANIHVDQTNDLAYTPLPLKILSNLVQACQTIKDRLTGEANRLKGQTPAAISTPACHAGTRVDELMRNLGTSTADQVDALATLTAEDKSRLATLNTDLASDPARGGRQLLALKGRLDAGSARIETMADAVADERVDEARTAYGAYTVACAAAQAASTALFAQEPLPHIGSDVWRSLWQAARAYSEQEAYAGQAFPATADGARCVLCLQELQGEAAARLGRFELFVKDESKRREVEALVAYNEARTALHVSMAKAEREALIAMVRDEVGRADLTDALRAALLTTLWRSRCAGRTHRAASMRALPVLQAAPLEALRAESVNLQNRLNFQLIYFSPEN